MEKYEDKLFNDPKNKDIHKMSEKALNWCYDNGLPLGPFYIAYYILKENNKLFSTDEIILTTIKEKQGFESHKDDISYACHHKKVWSLIESKDSKYDDKTLTLSELKEEINKLT